MQELIYSCQDFLLGLRHYQAVIKQPSTCDQWGLTTPLWMTMLHVIDHGQ